MLHGIVAVGAIWAVNIGLGRSVVELITSIESVAGVLVGSNAGPSI